MEMEMEMPTPCNNCGEIFDLNDGRASPRQQRIVICESCANTEEEEIERENEIADLCSDIDDAESTIKHAKARLVELGTSYEKEQQHERQ